MKISLEFRSILKSLALATIMTIFLIQRHHGFGLILMSFALFPWILYSIFVIFKKPSKRIIQTKKVFIWLIAIFIVISSHYYLHVTTRQHAQEIANQLHAYANKHGRYPKNIEAIGIDNAQLKAKLGSSDYRIEAGKPSFSYVGTFVPFEIENYDFETREWQHVND